MIEVADKLPPVKGRGAWSIAQMIDPDAFKPGYEATAARQNAAVAKARAIIKEVAYGPEVIWSLLNRIHALEDKLALATGTDPFSEPFGDVPNAGGTDER